MAKLGEGDPRWIVQDRADGVNVNNWHWVEKDCTAWMKQKLSEMFLELLLVNEPGCMVVKTAGLDSLSGEAFLNNRKNKMVASYELEVKVKWEATVEEAGASEKTAGLIHFPYIADENFDEEPEIRITTEDTAKVGAQAKSAILFKGKQLLLERIHTLLKDLKAGGPAKDTQPQPAAADPKPKLSSAPVEAPSKPAAKPAFKSLTKFTLTERFYARPSDIFECLTIEPRVKAFTQSDANIDRTVGGKFSWFNGSVQGVFKEMCEPSKLVMDWRFSTWEDDCFSKVVIEFKEPDPGNTVVTLTQTNIPEADKFGNQDVLDMVERGWRSNVFQRIRGVFGYGV